MKCSSDPFFTTPSVHLGTLTRTAVKCIYNDNAACVC